MTMKKRKRVSGYGDYVVHYDNYSGSWSEDDLGCYPVDGVGQAMKNLIQCSTRLAYVSSKKVSDSSHNRRQHYCGDGKRKRAFNSIGMAKSVCARLWDKGEDMNTYKCDLCNKFHIGHKKGDGHSVPYKLYKIGEVAELLIDCAFAMQRLFAQDDNAYPHLPPYHVRSTKG